MNENKITEEMIKEARNKYYRDYYKRPGNKEKKKEYMRRYWEKKISKEGND